MQNQQPQAQAPQGGAGSAQMLAPPQQGGLPAHLMGLMTNPTLAAAAAASPLFPPAAMLSNSGAFLAMPEIFANSNSQHQQGGGTMNPPQQQGGAPVGGMVHPGMSNNFGTDGSMQQQQQHSHGVSPVPGAMNNQNGQNQSHHNPFHHLQSHEIQQQLQQLAPTGNFPDDMGDGKDDKKAAARRNDLTPEMRAKQNRDRNREHARSTRLRKKAYVQKLKELVEGLHAERTEEVRQRRVAIQHLAEMQNVRRGVVRTFLRFHSHFETEARKWETILEDNFWLKQPVTPYRSFRRTEIVQDCRISRGVQGMISDSASVAVMIEGIGSRSTRWMQIKREEFLLLEESKRGPSRMPQSIVQQDSRLQAGVSSLSSSSGSSNGSAIDEADKQRTSKEQAAASGGGKKVSESTGSSSDSGRKQLAGASKDFHDYHAQPLPDPKLGDSGSTSPSEDSPEAEESNSSTNGDAGAGAGGGKRVCTDSSSGDDSAAAIAAPRPVKRQKTDSGSSDTQDAPNNKSVTGSATSSALPPNIAKTGGVQLAPFAGIHKRPAMPGAAVGGDNLANASAAVVTADNESSSSNSSQLPQIRASYHVNEDDMILMEDVLMCPFVLRSQDAVVCGALAECVMPGMFRAHFSNRNKLLSVEMVYDAMGFMQQLERASGSERTAQIIPGSLEMALSPTSSEARVITLAEPPFLIVSVNEVWTRMTKYTQMEVEGRDLLTLLEGEKTLVDAGERPGKPRHNFEDVAKGQCASSTNIHYDKEGRDFVDYVCSYPLTNTNDEITHLLHISKDLPPLPESMREQ